MRIEVTSCRYLKDYRLWVRFGDGREGVVRWTDPAPATTRPSVASSGSGATSQVL